ALLAAFAAARSVVSRSGALFFATAALGATPMTRFRAPPLTAVDLAIVFACAADARTTARLTLSLLLPIVPAAFAVAVRAASARALGPGPCWPMWWSGPRCAAPRRWG